MRRTAMSSVPRAWLVAHSACTRLCMEGGHCENAKSRPVTTTRASASDIKMYLKQSTRA